MSYKDTKHLLGVLIPNYSLENRLSMADPECCLEMFLKLLNGAVMLEMKTCVQVCFQHEGLNIYARYF